MILRRWQALIRTEDRAAYQTYVLRTGGADYAAVPGNLGHQLLFRDLGDGRSEVTTLSWWRDLDAIRAFAGKDIARARYYPEDDRWLLTKPEHVEHHEVAADAAIGRPVASSGGA
jgi:heme-degrading monooxygenase HmoA